MYRGIQPKALPCPVGSYREPGDGTSLCECKFCPRGTYGNLPGLETSTCTAPCPKGTYNDRFGELLTIPQYLVNSFILQQGLEEKALMIVRHALKARTVQP